MKNFDFNFDLDSNSAYLTLITKGKQSYRVKLWDKYNGTHQAKQKGTTQFDTYVKRNVECDYIGKLGSLAKIVLK